jgi:C-terminal peptidase prc
MAGACGASVTAQRKDHLFMTKAKLTGLLAGLVLVALSALPLRAAETQPHPYVVLVGISQYGDKQIKPRPHAEADAKALYDLFTNKEYLGVDADHVHLLLGSPDAQRKSEPATHDNILKVLRWVTTQAGHDDLVIFAFIGQGAPLGGSGSRLGYLAADSTLKDRAKNALAAGEIGEILDKLKSQRFCAFLDVDFHGYHEGPEKLAEPTLGTSPYKEFRGSDGTDDEAPTLGRVLFLATNGLSPSLDLDQHGLFTQVVLDGLKGAADREGYEPDGVVTVDELWEYLDRELPEKAQKIGKTDEEKRQAAHILQGHGTHFVLTQNPAVTAQVAKRLADLAALEDDKKITAEMATEGKKLLARMPKLKTYQDLRRSYEQLVDGKIDVDEFTKKREHSLAELKLKRSAAFDYAAKVIQATQVIKEGYVKSVNQGDLVAWAIRGLYRQIDEKVPAEVRDRLQKVKVMTEPELTAMLADVRERLGKREDLENHKDLDYSLQRMLSHLDPYTTYIDPEMLQRFDDETSGHFKGIGIQIHENRTKGALQVITPLKGSPAYKAGLKAGDLITTITREVDEKGHKLEHPEVISTRGMTTNDAVKKIKGMVGTKVKLTVTREGVDHPLEFEVPRATIEVETVLGLKRKSNDEWDYWVDPSNKIAYVRVTTFARKTANDLLKVLTRLNRQGVQGFVLDLRFNPGGLLTSAVEISDFFIDDGLIVSIKPRAGREASYTGEHEGSFLNFPMVCLVNGMSASGSEIVAACLQDHRRAVILGERSYGKGSVQNIQPFEGGELKLTTASFWRPNGKNLNKSSTQGRPEDEWGVSPDKGYTVSLSEKEREQLYDHQRDAEIIPRRDGPVKEAKAGFKDRQLEQALDYLRGQIKTASKARPPKKKAG